MQRPRGRPMQRSQGGLLPNGFVIKMLVWRSLTAIAQGLLPPLWDWQIPEGHWSIDQECPLSASCQRNHTWCGERDRTLLPKHSHACPTGGLWGIPYRSLPWRQWVCHSCKACDNPGQGYCASPTHLRWAKSVIRGGGSLQVWMLLSCI